MARELASRLHHGESRPIVSETLSTWVARLISVKARMGRLVVGERPVERVWSVPPVERTRASASVVIDLVSIFRE